MDKSKTYKEHGTMEVWKLLHAILVLKCEATSTPVSSTPTEITDHVNVIIHSMFWPRNL